MLFKTKRQVISEKQKLERIIEESNKTIEGLKDKLSDAIEANSDLRYDNENYRQAVRELLEECSKPQFNSVLNLQNKIKEITTRYELDS